MNKIKLLLALLFLFSVVLCAQDVDSLFSLYTQSSRNKQIVLANEIARTVYELDYVDTLFQIDNNLSTKHQQAIISEVMGYYAKHQHSDYNKSTLFYLEAAKLYEQVGEFLSADIMYGDAAINYHYLGEYEKSVQLLMKCYVYEKEIDDKEGLSVTLNSLGIVHSQWGQHEAAIRFFQEAIDMERVLARPLYYANRLASLAKETLLLGEAKEALPLIEEALAMDETLNEGVKGDRIAVHLNIKGDIYFALDSLEQAEASFRLGLQFFEKKGNQRMEVVSLMSLGRLYLKEERYKEGIDVLTRCIALAEAYTIRRSKREALNTLHQLYKQTDQPQLALSTLEQFIALNDSLFQESTQQQINEFQVKYDTQQKDVEILRQQAEIEKHKTRQYVFIGGLVIAGILVALLMVIVNLRNKRNRVLAEINTTKDKFFSIISHDLKNPVIAQRDALQQLIAHSGKWDTESLSLYYEELLKSADGQVELLYNLLNWAQVQTGRMPYKPALFDLTAELHLDIALIRNMADRKGITLGVQMPDTAMVTGDRNMLTTVVRNLLTNAVKFTGKDGCITLEIQPEENSHCRISVTDTGTGMSREQMKTLFLLDSQRSKTGTAGEHGSGIGLLVCKELIEKHGSTLHVESEEGKGSRFWFTI
ncbi:ATP-binding protein [Parabacteroides sp. PF5-9]|uniref:ATP-binding protein n=1 Tax=Parabacteroides sp. PF5-9 TaxID=1742404 RepID=UPI00247621C5|nr:ATP-binding protein [Parabacteroides sp. PF5-9]MDH6356994.1 signal transduction histidine kinase [Parabacteroides sp. PF5-9]